MLIYKLFRAAEWGDFDAVGLTCGAPVDRADGYIHFSTAEQLPETLRRHFTGETGLVLAAVEAEGLGAALTWETARGGARFPHLYRALERSAVLWSLSLPEGPDGAVLPEDLA